MPSVLQTKLVSFGTFLYVPRIYRDTPPKNSPKLLESWFRVGIKVFYFLSLGSNDFRSRARLESSLGSLHAWTSSRRAV